MTDTTPPPTGARLILIAANRRDAVEYRAAHPELRIVRWVSPGTADRLHAAAADDFVRTDLSHEWHSTADLERVLTHIRVILATSPKEPRQ